MSGAEASGCFICLWVRKPKVLFVQHLNRKPWTWPPPSHNWNREIPTSKRTSWNNPRSCDLVTCFCVKAPITRSKLLERCRLPFLSRFLLFMENLSSPYGFFLHLYKLSEAYTNRIMKITHLSHFSCQLESNQNTSSFK